MTRRECLQLALGARLRRQSPEEDYYGQFSLERFGTEAGDQWVDVRTPEGKRITVVASAADELPLMAWLCQTRRVGRSFLWKAEFLY